MSSFSRKTLSILVTIVFVLSFTGVAFAAEPAPLPDEPLAEAFLMEETPAEAEANTAEPQAEEPVIPTEEQAVQNTALVPAEELLAMAIQNGAQTALHLNEYPADDAFFEILHTILNIYYTHEDWDALAAFTAEIDSRAAGVLHSYEQAFIERNTDDLPYEPGEILVLYKENVDEPMAVAMAEEERAAVVQTIDLPNVDEVLNVVEIPLDQTVEEAVAQFDADPNVELAQPNFRYELDEAVMNTQAGDPNGSYQWHHNTIDTAGAWDIIDTLPNREKVRVAVIDSAANIKHPDLQSSILTEYTADMQNGGWQPYPATYHDHGTHVSGIIAATANNSVDGAGVASGTTNSVVELVPINVCYDSSGRALSTALISAIAYTWDFDCDVVNISMGAKWGGAGNKIDEIMIWYVDRVTANGTTIICSAGNDNSSDTYYPADIPSTISVINSAKDNTKAASSNYGATKDISAPGMYIVSTVANGQYGMMSGTSMAAPVVTGVVALMKYANPELTPEQIRTILHETATDIGAQDFDIYTAYGNVNAKRAVQKALDATSSAPSTTPLSVPPPTGLTGSIDEYGTIGFKFDSKKIGGNTYADGVYLYRSTQPNSGYQRVLASYSVAYQAVDSTIDTKSETQKGKTYYYKIAGVVFDENFKMHIGELSPDYVKITIPGGAKEPVQLPEAPKAPTGAAATPAGANSVMLEWEAVPGAEGYIIYRSTAQNGTYVKEGEIVADGQIFSYAGKIGFESTGLKADTIYYYKIVAYVIVDNARVEGTRTAALSARTAKEKPTVAKPENVSAQTHKDGIALSWNAVGDATGYHIYRATTASGNYTNVKTTSGTSYTDTSAAAGSTYYYYVVAYKTSGGVTVTSEQSDTVSAAAGQPDVLAAPTGLSATSYSYSHIKITWNAVPNATGYYLHYSTSASGTYSKATYGSSATSAVQACQTGTTYYFKIQAYQIVNGKTVLGNISSVATGKAQLSKPATLVAKGATDKSIKLTWGAVKGANGYEIYRADSKRGTYRLIHTVANGSSTTYTDASCPQPRTKYYYKIRAYRTVNQAKVTGTSAGPKAGQTKTKSVSNVKTIAAPKGKLMVYWTKNSGATGYQVYRATSKNGTYKRVGSTKNTQLKVACTPGKTYYFKVRHYVKSADGKTSYGSFSSVISASY